MKLDQFRSIMRRKKKKKIAFFYLFIFFIVCRKKSSEETQGFRITSVLFNLVKWSLLFPKVCWVIFHGNNQFVKLESEKKGPSRNRTRDLPRAQCDTHCERRILYLWQTPKLCALHKYQVKSLIKSTASFKDLFFWENCFTKCFVYYL